MLVHKCVHHFQRMRVHGRCSSWLCAADSFHNAGPHGNGSHVMHAHHDVPYSVSYTETMQQPLSPMVVGPNMDQQQKDHNQMAQHLNLHGENVVHG